MSFSLTAMSDRGSRTAIKDVEPLHCNSSSISNAKGAV